jgi:hypothetical protein
MGSTTAQYMPTGFNGFVSFFFTNDIVLLPGVKHYLEPVHIFGTDNWSVAYASMNLAQYAGGGLITYGTESIYSDMWFREGVLLTPSAEAPVRNSNGTVSIKFTSAPGSTNYTQVATNFVNPVWVNVATNILGTNVLVTNSYTWSYTNFATNGPTRYYRSYTLPQ